MSKKIDRHNTVAAFLRRIHDDGMTLTHALVLYQAAALQSEDGPATLGAIGHSLEMPASTLSRVAWDLVQAGHAEQQDVPGDRRARRLVVRKPEKLPLP